MLYLHISCQMIQLCFDIKQLQLSGNLCEALCVKYVNMEAAAEDIIIVQWHFL